MTLSLTIRDSYVVQSLSRFWPNGSNEITNLPMPKILHADAIAQKLPPEFESVELPDWASELGVDGCLLVPVCFVENNKYPQWEHTDWLGAIFWYLNGVAEKCFEEKHGPVHSYAWRLGGWDQRVWQRAWVNRTALFLRRWVSTNKNADEAEIFGPLPQARIIVTHDVDAVKKTLPIRLKQAAFHLYNGGKSLSKGKPSKLLKHLKKMMVFLFGADNYWCFDTIEKHEQEYGVQSIYNFFSGKGGYRKSIKKLIFDPLYCVREEKLQKQLIKLLERGNSIGLHSSFNAWANSGLIKSERLNLEMAIGKPINSIRQHWLRFSWKKTWSSHDAAGFHYDYTLGFNDRPGFRTGAAVCYQPWSEELGAPLSMKVIPTAFMDSHFFDYGDMDQSNMETSLIYWLEEIKASHGVASIIWHQRVFSKDYGWGELYPFLLKTMQEMGLNGSAEQWLRK